MMTVFCTWTTCNACMVMKVSTLELSSANEVFQCVFVLSHGVKPLCLFASAVVLLMLTISRPLRSPLEATPLVSMSPVTRCQVCFDHSELVLEDESGSVCFMSASLSQMHFLSASSRTCAAHLPDPVPVTWPLTRHRKRETVCSRS